MKKKLIVVLSIFMMILLITPMDCYDLNMNTLTKETNTKSSPQPTSNLIGAEAAKADTDLTLEDMLTYAIQNEYLAKAQYSLVIEKLGKQPPFTDIISEEENHIYLLKFLLSKYKVPLPVDNSKDYLKTPTSLKESLEAGAQGETEAIAMYNRFLNQNLPDDVRFVFTKLRDISQKHLQDFQTL